MSVQLILYPQSYNGQYNAISNVGNEKLVDGINFSTINTSASVDVASITSAAPLSAEPPDIINTWYRSRSTVTVTPTLPSSSGGSLYLYSAVGSTTSTVYQRLSNLTIGATYNLLIKFDNTAAGSVYLAVYNGDTLGVTSGASMSITSAVAGQTFIQFTAQTTQDIIQISYYTGFGDTFEITGMSVIPTGQMVTYTNFELEDGQVICDLYQEEDIPLTLSVDDFKNLAEKVQSYSKDFNLPATKRNNLIFDHIFEITRSDDGLIFNPYIKTQCVLKQDGYILFEGYLRLIDVQDQEGEISYNVNLYSEVIALADVLENKTFNDIDYTELEHDYNKTSIKQSWTTGIGYPFGNTSGYRDADTLKYPFVDDGTFGTANYPQLVNLEQAFRPFMNIKYLINRIFEDTPFSWSSDFFDTTKFGKLYMDFNWGSAEYGAVPDLGGTLIQEDSMASDWFIQASGWKKLRFDVTQSGDNSLWNNTAYTFTSTVQNLDVTVGYNINLVSVASVYTYSNDLRIAKFDAAGNHLETFVQDDSSIAAGSWKTVGYPPNIFGVWPDTFSTTLGQGEYIQVQSAVVTSNKIKMDRSDSSSLYFQWNNVGMQTDTLLASAREDIGHFKRNYDYV